MRLRRPSSRIPLNILCVLPKNRTHIPRLPYCRWALESVRAVNAFLEKQLPGLDALEKVIDLFYAGAVTVCEMLGLEILDRPMVSRPTVTPPWKKRLEHKISNMRRKICVILLTLVRAPYLKGS